MTTLEEKLISVRPSQVQLDWQRLGFTAFLHYGINTFTDREWGDGKEDPALYNPDSLDTDQWCRALKAAGVTACIITAKHHDGFCLFDTAYTNHGVMHSPKPVDVVAALAKSCKKYGLKLGVYLSPWDRNHPDYGSGKAYDDFFCNQLEELTTKYGDLYSLWFDGACGEGPNGKKQVYDWDRYYALIRKNQPGAAITVCGPDVRWIGNEGGHTRPSEWSVVPLRLRDQEGIAQHSQQADDAAFSQLPIASTDEDLGSRAFLEKELAAGGDLCWYPAEVDVSIRPGWFYHANQDDKVRSVANLLDIYEKSVGGNAVLLLNIPPDTHGQISPADEARLQELGDRIGGIYSVNLLADADIVIENSRVNISAAKPVTLTHLVLREDVTQSQRVEAFVVSAEVDGAWQTVYTGTTIGFKKICRFAPVTAANWRVDITECRSEPILGAIEGHLDPEAGAPPAATT